MDEYFDAKIEPWIQVTCDMGAKMPIKAHNTDAGFDLRSPIAAVVPAGGSFVFDTGVHMAIPKGYFGSIRSKSGLNIKHDIISDGVIDSGYTGSIVVKLYNLGKEDYMVEAGDKISQIIIQPYSGAGMVLVPSLKQTERGDNGFGSSGR